jgi:hypothetical protein
MPVKDIVLASHDNDAWYWAHSQVCVQLILRYCTILLITCISNGEVQILDVKTGSRTPPSKTLPANHIYPESYCADVFGHKRWAGLAFHRDVALYALTSMDCT